MAQSDVWYYAVGGESKGPFTESQLRSFVAGGTIPDDNLVWSEEIGEWRPFSQTRLASAPGGAAMTPAFPSQAAPSRGYNPQSQAPAQSVSFGDAIRLFFSNYARFSGRATRPEFWFPVLFAILLGLVTGVLDVLVVGTHSGVRPVSTLAQLAILIPSLSVGVRRLHDTDRSGWWYLIVFIPLIGGIVLLVFFCQRGTQGPNRFG